MCIGSFTEKEENSKRKKKKNWEFVCVKNVGWVFFYFALTKAQIKE